MSSFIEDCDFVGGSISLVDDDEVKINGRTYTIGDDSVLFTIDPDTNTREIANYMIQDIYMKWLSNSECSIRKALRDLVFKKHQITSDVWGAVILAAIHKHYQNTGALRFYLRELYPTIALYLGAKEEDVLRKNYVCYHPDNGKQIKDMGYVRTWIQERSPCSRQRYWRNNKCSERTYPLLFINPVLGRKNVEQNWMPGSQVRGDYWYFDPDEANRWYVTYKPTPAVLAAADAHINPAKRGCMRGSGHSVASACAIGTVSSFRFF